MKNNAQAVWTPKDPEKSQMWSFCQYITQKFQAKIDNYQQLHAWSVANLADFWQAVADFFKIKFDQPPQQILNNYQHMLDAHWFSGATLNYAEHLLRRCDQHPALVCLNEKAERQVITYQELNALVGQCATGLRQAGVQAGDRVVAVLPNVAYPVIALLAAASIGAIWSSCSPDFGVDAIIERLGQLDPKVIFLPDGQQHQGKIYDFLPKAQQLIPALKNLHAVVICPVVNTTVRKADWQFVQMTVTSWVEFLSRPTCRGLSAASMDPVDKPRDVGSKIRCQHSLDFQPLPFDHPLCILFSSGTTGQPKCIVHGAGGTLLQHIKEHGLHGDMRPEDNMLFYTTCGWMMWNWMVSALAFGATLTLYEGAALYPTSDHLFKVLADEKISVFGTSAKYISAVDKAGVKPNSQYQLPNLRCILTTGSPLLAKNYDFVYEHIKKDVQLSSISGGTDIVSCFALGNPLVPVYRGELQSIGLGLAVDIVDAEGNSLPNTPGELVCRKPFPSMPIMFWQDANKERYQQAYFAKLPGIWVHGDQAQLTQHGGLIIYGRSDATLNPGGVRIGTAEIYRQVEKVSAVVDSVVIGQDWQDDVRIVLFVKLQPGLTLDEKLQQLIRQTIRQNASPRHVPAVILQVPDIPHTINGKVVELAVRELVHGRVVKNMNSIANPEALEFFVGREELS